MPVTVVTTSPNTPIPPERLIDATRLSHALEDAPRSWSTELVDETESTNSDLLARARTGEATQPVFRLAYRQTAGRGRQGRRWAGGPSMTFSLAYPLPLAPSALSGLSLACGLALAQGISAYAPAAAEAVRLKWPNDLEIGGRKLAGILVETVRGGGALWAVIGIGLNLSHPVELEDELGRKIAGLADLEPEIDPTRLLASIINHLARTLDVFAQSGLPPLRADWEALDAYRGRPVRLLRDGVTLLEGIARGIDDSGQLMVETAAGLQPVISGELSLRPAEGT